MKITLLNTLLKVHSKVCKTVKARIFTRVVPSLRELKQQDIAAIYFKSHACIR